MKFDEFDPAKGLEVMARQFWSAWGDFARTAEAPAGQMPGWQQAVDWWSQLAHGGREEANAAVEQFNRQSAQWFGLMQSVAAQFAGQDGSAADVARAWQKAVGAQGDNPFPELFRGLRGRGLAGLEQWIEDASPYLDAWRKEATGLLGLPTFGLMREHQERWQQLQQAQIALRQSQSAYQALLAKAGQRAFEIFEGKLEERSEPGRQLETARDLFDLWIDAAEEGYAEVALSPEFRRVYGQMVNDMMRLRASVQDEVERATGLFGIPGRSEVDAGHRKLHALEKQVRALQAELKALKTSGSRPSEGSAPATSARAEPAPKAKPRPARAQAAKPAAKATAPAGAAKAAAPKPKAAKPAAKASRPARAVVNVARMPLSPSAPAEAAGTKTGKTGKSTKSRSAKA